MSDLATLRRLPFLAGIPDDFLLELAPNLTEQRFATGQRILEAGQYCDGAYYLASGVVEVKLGGEEATAGGGVPARAVARVRGNTTSVRRAGAAPADGTLILSDLPIEMFAGQRATIEAGDIFGETSALSRYPVSSDVVAASEVVCWLIGTAALRKMFDRQELANFKSFFDKRYRERTLASVLRRVDLFRDVDEKSLDGLKERAELLSFKPGRVIVEQGSASDALYLVRGGYVRVAVRTGGDEVAVSYLRKGDHAGEVGVLLGEPWPFSLTALEHVELIKIARTEIDEIIGRCPPVERRLWQAAVGRLKERGGVLRDPLSSQPLQYAMDSGLIHGESVLLIDLETCTRCDECVRACADVHDGTPRFIREGAKFRNFSAPAACYHCTDPVCMIGCPTGAISRPLGTLEVTINEETCIGCGNCGRRCPWTNIQNVPIANPQPGAPTSVATKCDLCIDRDAGPACVQMCPHGAAVRINFKDLDRVRHIFERGTT